MWLKMVEFETSYLESYFKVALTRGEDTEAIALFGENGLPAMEKMCADSNNGWLFGTETPSMLDVNCAPIFEAMYLQQFTVFKNVFDQLKLNETAPNLLAYAERFRNHPDVKGHRMVKTMMKRHHERTRGWDKNVKCQLSLEI